MINYVNNAFDKVLKPCDAQQFNMLVKSLETEKLILGHRGGDQRCKPKLPAITYMGALDTEKYKQYLRQCEEQDTRPLGSRRAEFMRPTGLFMLDFDHVEDPRFVYERILQVLDVAGLKPAEILALVHITPSGDGLRVVMERTKGQTIEQDQLRWSELIGIKIDAVCKDISRLSFAPMHKEILYFNPGLLFKDLPDAGGYPDGSVFQQPLAAAPPAGVAAPVAQGEAPAGYDTEYGGVPYPEIVARLEEQLGGRPEHGARNSFIFTMACNLRYICNDDAAWIASILPTYGEDPQKHRATVQSAVNRPMSREMPETLKRALRIGAAKKTVAGSITAATPPELPAALPEPVALLVSRTPEAIKAAVAMAVFPPLGAHLHGAKFRYWDGRDYEATFMNVLVAELSSGKSAVNTPIEYVIADMEARDEVAREKLNSWKDACNRIPSTQVKPERPKGVGIQVLDPDMTNAAFVQALADAEGRFLYTQMDEVDLLNALKTNTQGNTVSAILRLAFDCGKYGQVRVASNAVNAKVRVRWNWNASTTIQRVRKFFAKNIADGTLSRLSFATIVKDDDDWGDIRRPLFGEYGQAFADELRPYIDALCTASGTIVCPEAIKWADALSLELIGYAREIDDRTYAQLSFRAVLMGFFRAMLLYIANGCRWSQVIADFAEWTVRYDLWCKFRFFRDMLHKDLSGEKASLQSGPISLLALLPEEFTKQQVQDLRIAEGMNPDPRKMLDNWKRRGYISFDDVRKLFVKCPQSSVLS
ncbi:MAG: hypothetical protein IJE15_00475 [Bacteroidaceae bacterium]|nr:hypothetical protein [Bacteroidaceae bacterium]